MWLLLLLIAGIECAPLQNLPNDGGFVLIGPDGYQIRQFDPIGSWIQNSDWFPIEVNVPDAINNIGQQFTNFGQGISQWGSSIIQRIPWINRIISQVRPRPIRYFVLVPVQAIRQHHQNKHENNVNFDGDELFFHNYP